MPANRSTHLLMVRTNVLAEGERLFNEWYSTVHLPQIVSVPGIRWGRRYQLSDESATYPAPPGEHTYLAIYELGDASVLSSAEFLATRGWSDEVRPYVRDTRVTVYRLLAAEEGEADTP